MNPYSIKVFGIDKKRMIIDFKISNQMSRWFTGLPGHCEAACCGFACLYLPENDKEMFTEEVSTAELKEWLISAIEAIEKHPDAEDLVAHPDDQIFDICGGDLSGAKKLFQSILFRIDQYNSRIK